MSEPCPDTRELCYKRVSLLMAVTSIPAPLTSPLQFGTFRRVKGFAECEDTRRL